jgi:hypothetical protein
MVYNICLSLLYFTSLSYGTLTTMCGFSPGGHYVNFQAQFDVWGPCPFSCSFNMNIDTDTGTDTDIDIDMDMEMSMKKTFVYLISHCSVIGLRDLC